MTYSYNASHPLMVGYIKEALMEGLIRLDDKDPKVYYVTNETVYYLTSKYISNLVKYFGNVINYVFPNMNELKSYLKAIVKICLKLNMPIP